MMGTYNSLPAAGFGLGLRRQHYRDVVETQPRVDWFEIISENYMEAGGRPRYYLEQVRAHYPVVMHGVSLSIGSVDPLNYDYLHKLRDLAAFVEPARISDHLCWTGVDHTNLHDLLPLPYTEEALQHVAGRVSQVQEFLGRRLLLENVSSYLSYAESEMTEWDFLAEVATRADCHILLDVNNVYVSAHNHGFDPRRYIKAMPAARVQQIHLAGHSVAGAHLIDTHDAAIVDPVWDLYAYAVGQLGAVATMIERDDNIPPLAALVQELALARRIAADASQECVA
jgi:uncharacterized protein (UPF0276 family)